jgi:serine/threonine protein kinase
MVMAPRSFPSADPEANLRFARAELQRRLESGQQCRAEDLLAELPVLSANASLAIDLVYAEFVLRQQLGQRPDPADWLARFPQWQEQLRRQFQVHGLLAASSTGGVATLPEVYPGPPQLPPTALEQPPERFGQYELLEELGRGGMGVVYKARDLVLTRVVALKRVRSGTLARPDEIERFFLEARAAGQLAHRHIVPILDFGEHSGQHYFTMPFAAGGSLAAQHKRFAEPRAAAALVEKIARAVHAAHEKGIVHRDLKPANVLLDEQDEPLVGDFGLAKFRDAGADLTQTGQVLGTPAYMAPEQAAGHDPVDPRADVWSLGVILYELLTGQRPFTAQGLELCDSIRNSEPPRPRTLRPGLDLALETVVLKCLQKAPPRRYATALALADDLARWQAGEPILARPEGWPRRAWRKARRHPAVSVAVVLLVLFAGTLALLAPWLRQPAEAEPPWAPVAFVRPEGLTGEARWAFGTGTIAPQGGDVVRLETTPKTLGMLELRPAPPGQRYRFSAEVQHLAPCSGEVGLYLACHEQAGAAGRDFWFLQFAFADRDEFPAEKGKPLQGRAQLVFRRRVQGAHPGGPVFDHNREIPRPANFPAAPEKWHSLAIEVRPDVISVFWDLERPLLTLPTTSTLEVYRQELASLPGLPDQPTPPFGNRGGLGLLCDGGAALFRHPVLEPLPPGR